MKYNYLAYSLFELRKEMTQKGFLFLDPLFVDDQRHEYQKGTPKEWSYIITLDGLDSGEVLLICSYGLRNSTKQHAFVKPVRKET